MFLFSAYVDPEGSPMARGRKMYSYVVWSIINTALYQIPRQQETERKAMQFYISKTYLRTSPKSYKHWIKSDVLTVLYGVLVLAQTIYIPHTRQLSKRRLLP